MGKSGTDTKFDGGVTAGRWITAMALIVSLACDASVSPEVPEEHAGDPAEISIEELEELFRSLSTLLSAGASNTSAADVSARVTTDTIPPTLSKIETDRAGSDLILTFSEPVTVPDFVQSAADSLDMSVSIFYRAVASVTLDGDPEITFGATVEDSTLTYRLTSPSIGKGQSVAFAYDNVFAEHAVSLMGGLIVDTAGNALPTFSEKTVTNRTRYGAGANNVRGPLVSPGSLVITQGESDSLAVRLRSAPTGSVTVDLDAVPEDFISLNTDRLTFTSSNWDQDQYVTFDAQAADLWTADAWALIVATRRDVNAQLTREGLMRVLVKAPTGQ